MKRVVVRGDGARQSGMTREFCLTTADFSPGLLSVPHQKRERENMVALLQRCVFRAFLQHLDAGSAQTPLLGASAALVRAHRSAWQQRSSSGEYYFVVDLICTFLVFALQKKTSIKK